MPVTAAGTPFTVHTWTNAEGDPSVWAVADHLENTDYRKPVLLYCHGSGGTETQFTDRSPRLRDALIDNGWVYIESLGGGTQHWGREFAMQSYVAAATEAAQMHPLGQVVVMGRSMGGTVSSSLALKPEWGFKQYVCGLLLDSGVQSLVYWHITMGKGLNGQYPDAAVDEQAFLEASEPFDPLRFPVSLYEDMPVQFVSGTHDASVPIEGNAEPQYERIRSVAPYAGIFRRGLGTHNTTEPNDDPVFNTHWTFIRQAQGLYPHNVNLSVGGSAVQLSGVHYPTGWRTAAPLTS